MLPNPLTCPLPVRPSPDPCSGRSRAWRSGRAALLPIALAALLGTGCSFTGGTGTGTGGWREDAPPPANDGPGDLTRARLALDVDVRDLPKSRIGNPPHYTVFGQRYAVMDTAAGFREQGVASWYGAKFHGRDTSSGEPYDMHRMTAAHKHLPLPTFVRVTRSDTGRSIVVKVNDRGPFVGDRIIDLSYGAAARLDMLDSGTAPVSIEALSTHRPGSVKPVETLVARVRETPEPVEPVEPRGGSGAAAVPAGSAQWIQIGAFTDGDNARAALASAAGTTGLGGRVELDARDELYRVRMGPVSETRELDGAIAALALAGVGSYTMVTATHRAADD